MLVKGRKGRREEGREGLPIDRKEAIKGIRSKKGPDFKKVVMGLFGYNFKKLHH